MEVMVPRWLASAGLGQYTDRFAMAGVDEWQFRGLLMQDYPKFGVTSMEDKQRLFRLIKTVNAGGELSFKFPAAPPDQATAQLYPPPAGAPPPPPLLPSGQVVRTPPVGTAESPVPGMNHLAGGMLDLNEDDSLWADGGVPDGAAGSSPVSGAAFPHLALSPDDSGGTHSGPRRRRPSPERPRPPPYSPARPSPPRPVSSPSRPQSSAGGRPGGVGGPPEITVASVVAPGRPQTASSPARSVSAGVGTSEGGRSGGGALGFAAAAAVAVAAAALPAGDPPRIRVAVRKRPLNKREAARREEDILEMAADGCSFVVNEPKVKVDLTRYLERHEFVFDLAFDEAATSEAVYAATVQPLVRTLFRGGKATCFAFGQTGSGKTHTMAPLPTRAAADLLAVMAHPQLGGVALWLSFFEIYGGKIFDLLNGRRRLTLREDGRAQFCLVGLQEYAVSDVAFIKQLIAHGTAARCTGATGANAESSRGHAVLQLVLRPAGEGPAGRALGKLSFIDLAGSERGADTYENDRQTRLEGAEINKSLLALKECIRALDLQSRHIPFRGSKLTEVLRDSFIGPEARTVMIANVSPSSSCCENSLNTLRYADRVRSLRRGGGAPPAGASAGEQSPRVLPDPRHAPFVAQLPRSVSVGGTSAPRVPAPTAQRGGDSRSDGRGGAGAAPGPSGGGGWGDDDDGGVVVGDGEDDGLALSPHQALMNTILEEEEEVIGLHRRQIEETMELVRREMALLADVDQPGSRLDDYVAQLGAILAQKAAATAALQAKLAKFARHLAEEEALSASAHSSPQR